MSISCWVGSAALSPAGVEITLKGPDPEMTLPMSKLVRINLDASGLRELYLEGHAQECVLRPRSLDQCLYCIK